MCKCTTSMDYRRGLPISTSFAQGTIGQPNVSCQAGSAMAVGGRQARLVWQFRRLLRARFAVSHQSASDFHLGIAALILRRVSLDCLAHLVGFGVDIFWHRNLCGSTGWRRKTEIFRARNQRIMCPQPSNTMRCEDARRGPSPASTCWLGPAAKNYLFIP